MTKKLLQLTMAIIKPHIIKQPHALEAVHNTILINKFYIIRSKQKHLTQVEAEIFYEEHKEKFFYNRLVTFMSSGTSEFLILARDEAIGTWRALMGPTKVYQAQYSHPDSIRGTFGLSDTRNATHGSDSPESAKREINLFFPEFDIASWYKREEENYRKGLVLFVAKDFIHVPLNM